MSFNIISIIPSNALFYCPLLEPSRVESIEHEAISWDRVQLRWRAPRNPNGIINFYFVSYTALRDMETFEIPHGDNCQFGKSTYLDY